MDFKKICNRWQRRWRTEKTFEAQPDNRPKFFLNVPYPYVNGYAHVGHLYTFMRGDATARYKRMRGFNVLFPQSFHATGSPIYAAAKRVRSKEESQLKALKLMGFKDEDIPQFEDPTSWIKIFSKAWEKDLADMGFSYDWRRTFITTDLNPRYSKFIQWQFRILKKKGLVEKGRHPVVWCPNCKEPTGDHARSEGEGEGPKDFLWVKFKLENSDLILMTGTTRPDALFGQTNLWIDPDSTYQIVEVDKEKWVIGKGGLKNMEEHWGKKPNIVGSITSKELIGKKVRGPLVDREIYILPADFIDSDLGTGLVYSALETPSDYMEIKRINDDENLRAKFNLDAEEMKKVQPIPNIKVEGMSADLGEDICKEFGAKSYKDVNQLEQAKHEINRRVFRKGIMRDNCGQYSGMTAALAQEKLKKELIEKKEAVMFYELTGKVICRCLTECHIKIVENQWFIKYGDEDWKQKTMKALQECKLYPEKLRAQFEYVIGWLRDWACTREYGLGTRLPWDTQWLIESLSDSTIYMAFYTIYHHLKKITLGNIDDKLFDYIFLGEGKPENINVDKEALNQMRNEFKYWYPVDFRNSGKDLVQNHLCFYLFNHAAIFPEKYWPRSIGINGYVNLQKQKMSKSKGIFRTLRQCIAEFGVDPTRITILSSGEEVNDVDWDPDVAKTMQNRLTLFYDFCTQNHSKTIEDAPLKAIDKWMEHSMNICIRDCTKAMDETLFRTALMKSFFDLQRHIKWYLKRTANKPNPKVISKVIEAQVKMLTPFCPHLCEEIWEKLGHKDLISLAEWPSVDENKINPAIEKSEQVMCQVIEDVGHVKKLAKIDILNQVNLFVADEWKFNFVKKLQELLKNTRNIGEIMKSILPHFQDRSKEVSQLVQKFVKDPRKIPGAVTNAESELQFLQDSKEFFEKEFNCTVTITKESDSEETKAKSAMPGKPAILVK